MAKLTGRQVNQITPGRMKASVVALSPTIGRKTIPGKMKASASAFGANIGRPKMVSKPQVDWAVTVANV